MVGALPEEKAGEQPREEEREPSVRRPGQSAKAMPASARPRVTGPINGRLTM